MADVELQPLQPPAPPAELVPAAAAESPADALLRPADPQPPATLIEVQPKAGGDDAARLDPVLQGKQDAKEGKQDGKDGKQDAKDAKGKDTKEGKKKEPPAPKVGFFALFRYATALEIVLLLLGALFAMASGVAQPIMTIIFS
jgi:hypothetical protein